MGMQYHKSIEKFCHNWIYSGDEEIEASTLLRLLKAYYSTTILSHHFMVSRHPNFEYQVQIRESKKS